MDQLAPTLDQHTAPPVLERCPVETTLDLISGKWKPLILFYLLSGTKRFNELHRLMPGVTRRMLTLHLRQLEEDGLIRRTIFAEVPPRVEYNLTPLGYTLKPILDALLDWGLAYAHRKEQ
jgi:DNA-binding HxlR family transcriptional regulator